MIFMNIFKTFMNSAGVDFKNKRTNQTVKGLKNSYKGVKILQFYPDTNLQVGDVLVFIETGEKFYLTDIQSMLWGKRVDHLNATYETESEHKKADSKEIATNVYNIQNANQSVIGTNAIGNFSYNFSDLETLIAEKAQNPQDFNAFLAVLQNSLENGQCPRGVMQRFADMLSKHSWLTGPIAQLLLSHFFAK